MAARKKKPGRPRRDAKMYPPGTPVDDHGAALEGVEVEGNPGMPLDAESARTTERHRDTMQRKAAGELRVKWNDEDPRIRYYQCLKLNTACDVAIRQLFPVESAVDGRSATMVNDYEKLITHIKNTHWTGEEATYEWKAHTKQAPQLAVGTISFKADPNWATRKATTPQEPDMSQQQPPGWGPPQGWPPYGYPQQPGAPYVFPPQPGYVGNPVQPQLPDPQAPQAPPQAPPPAQAQAAPPPPPPMPAPQMPQMPPQMQHPTADANLIEQLMLMTRAHSELMEENRRLKSGQPAPPVVPTQPASAQPTANDQYQAAVYQWYLNQQQQAQPQAPPQAPPNPMEQVSSSVDLMSKISNLGKEFARSFMPDTATTEEEKKKAADDFPLKVKDVGPVRVTATQDGELMTDPTTMFLMNSDKISDGLKSGLKEIRGMLKDRNDAVAQQSQGEDKNAEMRVKKLAQAKEFADTMERIKAAQPQMTPPPPMPPPPPQQVQAPRPVQASQPVQAPAPVQSAPMQPVASMIPATPVYPSGALPGQSLEVQFAPLAEQTQESPVPTPVEPHVPIPPAPKPFETDDTPVEVPKPTPVPRPESEEKQEETPVTPPQETTQSA